MKILVIDDDSSIRAFFKEFLKTERHEIVLAANGNEARRMILENGNLDVIVTDLRMPSETGAPIKANEGIEIVRFARLAGRRCRIILMSGDLTDIDATIAQAAGADFIIAKPFQIGELRHILNTVKKNGG
ncbi:MAG: response regulator [Patescibacteria group bacterium]